MVLNTKGYQGRLRKSARVHTDDPENPVARIRIQAFVKSAISLSSKTVYLKGPAGKTVTKGVTVKSSLKRPLELEPGYFDLPEKVTFRIEAVEKGALYWIYFTATPGPGENYRGTLKLKTNYPQMPEIAIQIMVRSQ